MGKTLYDCNRIRVCYSCIILFFRDFPVSLYMFIVHKCNLPFYLDFSIYLWFMLCSQINKTLFPCNMFHFSAIVCIVPIRIIVLIFFLCINCMCVHWNDFKSWIGKRDFFWNFFFRNSNNFHINWSKIRNIAHFMPFSNFNYPLNEFELDQCT